LCNGTFLDCVSFCLVIKKALIVRFCCWV
jgi:hypothetical protein